MIPRRYRGGQHWGPEGAARGPRFLLWGMPISLLAIMVLTILIEAALTAGDHNLILGTATRGFAYLLGAFHNSLLHGAREVFPGQSVSMFITYAFIHGGPVHLIVNMVALASFGMVIVQRIGQKRFLVAYLLCAIGGAAGFGLLSNSPAPMVGASGALFGLVGIWVCWDYLDRRHYGDPLWVTLRALVFLVLYNLVFFLLLHGSLAWETHLGGFVTGWLLAIYWGRRVLPESRRRRFGSEERPDA
ncbi:MULTISPECIES: rhomboid family intramembrane serine protease [unclassified Meridianimarinicoccus]|uniref:rhomboid family intramembrane serine protease n=1 Tax=unclassified Meridianimarinicoccus TaxID=2923344 RepID=UPI0018679107|nr:rhomboid family intramembrane serine protease [Fluviibacterium sp. MJW13]